MNLSDHPVLCQPSSANPSSETTHDEPFGGRSHQVMEADHWAQLAGVLGGHGIAADTRDLERLPHDVVLSERLLARVGHDPNDPVQP